jgi:hypothetical protein
MSLENPFAANPMENTNNNTPESVELNQEEQNVVQKSIELHKAMAEYDKVFPNMVARNQGEQLSDIYGEKWKKLQEEHKEMYNNLSPESQKKVWEKENEELGKLGLLQNQN